MPIRGGIVATICAGILLGGAVSALGEDVDPLNGIQKYRDMLKDDNPAELSEMSGEALWTTPRGPRQATLEACDLGLGPGVVEGAYARLPRWFPDVARVQDIESRLVTCMTTLQGMTAEQATKDWTNPGSDLENLVTYVAGKSLGVPIDVPALHPREAELAAIGEVLFFRRAGPLDFACATCHSQDGRRIRLQDLPNFLDPESARGSMTTWPAYRVSQSAVWTMERRLIDCIRQMRQPEPEFGSELLIALQVWLQKQANGGAMAAPGMKR
ncbi:MAG: sulfur oxidation c-type cytochrome SoxA [Betaproteobacteria bacterium]